jgi:hypothetical protein
VIVAALGAAAAVLPGPAGCTSAADRRGPDGQPGVATIVHKPAEIAKPISDSLASALAPSAGPVAPPKHALAISGGGQYAAYNAGLIVGWTASGTRPQFDVVTGISSGALVAGYAVLGEKYDPHLTRVFTSLRNKDLFVYRPLLGVIRNEAVANPKGLVELIEREVNDEFLADLRAAHGAGRRLYVGTMNVVTRRLTVWDVGAIACSGRPDAGDLVRKVALAAGSIPGLVPAVKFDVEVNGVRYTEEHVDAGATCQTFLRFGPGAERPADGATGWLTGSNLYAMAAGRLYAPLLDGKLGPLKRATSTVSAALYALYRAEATNLYAFCGVSGMKFHMIAIPEDAEVPPNSTSFDPAAMRKLYDLGYCQAKTGIPWRFTPPGAEPGEEEHPLGAEILAPPGR